MTRAQKMVHTVGRSTRFLSHLNPNPITVVCGDWTMPIIPHFMIPGAHVPCTLKTARCQLDSKGNPVPGYVWSCIALAIAYDRWNDASLFIEDCGFYASPTDDGSNVIVPYLDDKQRKVVNSAILCGLNQKVAYKEIFIGYKYLYCGPSEYGQALACAPYVLLAGSAYPSGSAQALVDMNLSEWAEAVLPKNGSQ